MYAFFDKILSPHELVRYKDTWYQDTGECIVFFCVGKDRGAGRYGDQMGSFLKRIMEEKREYPPYYQAPLRFGLSEFVDRDLVTRVFDLKNDEFKNEEREYLMREFVELYVLPFLKDVSTPERIKGAMDKYPALTYSTYLTLKSALGIPLPEE
jgi:hypothetical protein